MIDGPMIIISWHGIQGYIITLNYNQINGHTIHRI